MALKHAAIILLLGCGLIVISQPSSAAGTKPGADKPDPAARTVEKVLRAEVAGQVDRREQLAATLKAQPESASARWQAGVVRDGKSWRSFDDPNPTSADSDIHREYLAHRQKAPRTYEGQLELANWCRKRGLTDREQAHLFAAMNAAPVRDNTDLLDRLGCRRIGGIWVSRDDLREWHRLNQQAELSLKRWESKLNSIAQALTGSSRQREGALAKVRQLADTSAIPAIELTLAGQSEEALLVAIDVFKRLDGPEATVALAKQGVFSEWARGRHAAIEGLMSRSLDDFVPTLISLLAKPVTTEFRMLFRTPFRNYDFYGNIVLFYSYVLARETADRFQIATLRTVDFLVNEPVNGEILSGPEYRSWLGQHPFDFALERGHTDALRAAAARTGARDRAVADFNERTEQLNERIGIVLSGVSRQEPTADPDNWWKWWRAYSDTQQTGTKTVVDVSETEVVGNPFSQFAIISCFAAGTPVWTQQGLVPIEQIAVGDRILGKDVETGELAYRPVLQTTVRPPRELTTLRFGDETVVCTGGHRFWSSGSGWIKARDLTPQTLLHTVTGNTPVWSAREGSTAETYNLVVADFHTYFVGKTGVLCQDLLIPRGTNRVVPGLARK